MTKLLVKYFMFSLSFLICISVSARNRKFDKLLNKYDVPELAISATTSYDFWNAVMRYNEPFQKYYTAAEKKTKLYRTSHKESYELCQIGLEYRKTLSIDTEASGFCDTLLIDLGVKEFWPDMEAYIIFDDDVNACAYPDGKLYFNTGLFSLKGLTYWGLIGIAAHEATHAILQHLAVNVYAENKRLRNNQIAAAITVAAEAGAAAYATANGAGSDELWKGIDEDIQKFAYAARYDAKHKFHFKYRREQEFEADIVAYRFLEFLEKGRGDEYIKTLRLMGTEYDKYYTNDSDHPTTEDRIKLLEYIKSGENKSEKRKDGDDMYY